MFRITRRVAAFSVIFFVTIDVIVSFLIYSKNDHITVQHGKIVIPKFDLRTSQVDQCCLVFVRLALLFGALFGICRNAKKAVQRLNWSVVYVVCIFLTLAVYSLFKILTLAEVTTDFRLPWFWILVVWNVFASGVGALLWIFVLAKIQVSDAPSGGKKRSIFHHEDTERLMENGNVGSPAVLRWTECPLGSDVLDMAEKREAVKFVTDDGKPEEPKLHLKESSSLMWRLLKYARKEWPWYLVGFFFLIAYSSARIFIPFYTGRVISDIIVYHSYDRLVHSVIIMASLAVVSSISSGLRAGAFQYAIAKLSTRLRSELFASLVRQEIGFFDTTKTGDVTSRLTADCQAVSDTIAVNINAFLRYSIMLVGTLLFMSRLCWQLTVMTFIVIPLIAIISKVYGQFYERLSKQAQDSLAKASEVAEEVMSSVRTVRSFANEIGESSRYDTKLREVLNVRRKQTYAFIGYTWISELFDLLILIAVLWYGGHLVLTNKVKSEDLIAYLLYQLQLGEALINMGWIFTSMMQAVGASRKVFEWMDRKPNIPNDGKAKPTDIAGRIEFKDVVFSYPARPDAEVLKGVTFSAEPGEVIALVGPSGGGKSSCIALLEHFYEPSAGRILLDNTPIQNYDHRYLHKKIALVAQEPVLFACSIRENISYGLEPTECSDDNVIIAAKLANAHQFISALPITYETDVGEKGIQLSGGQKQRIAIARALVRHPRILLLDEATSALDAESEFLVQQALHQNLAGHTVILIAHRLSTVEKANKIIVIDGGRVVQQGTHSQLLEEDGLYRNLVHRQLLGEKEKRPTKLVLSGLQTRRSDSATSSPTPGSEPHSPQRSLSPKTLAPITFPPPDTANKEVSF